MSWSAVCWFLMFGESFGEGGSYRLANIFDYSNGKGDFHAGKFNFLSFFNVLLCENKVALLDLDRLF